MAGPSKLYIFLVLWGSIIHISLMKAQHKILHTRQSTPVVCGQPLYTAAISEIAGAGTFLTQASATDVNGVPLVWSIPDTTLTKFTINPTTGVVSLANQLTRMFMRSALEFTIRASESTNSQNFCEAVVRVNINPIVSPTGTTTGTGTGTSTGTGFAQPSYTFTASSCVVGGTVGQVFASTNGLTYTYSISGGSSYFFINPTSGLITLSALPPTGSQIFTVTAVSSSGPVSTVPVTITSTCGGLGTGTGQTSYTFTVTTCQVGSFVGQVAAISTFGGFTTYSLLGNQYFIINPQTGLITTIGIPPIGTQQVYVQAISSSGQISTIPVTITSSCNGGTSGIGFPVQIGQVPLFTQPQYSLTASSCTSGAYIGQVQALSQSGPVLYSIDGGNIFFSINPQSGTLTVQGSPPGGSQTFTVRAVANGYSASALVTVSSTCAGAVGSGSIGFPIGGGTGTGVGGGINSFSQPSYSFVSSSCTPGAFLGQVSAQFAGGTSTYSISGGNGAYTVNPSTGQVASSGQQVSGTATFQVLASSPSGSATASVSVTSTCSGNIGTGVGTGIGTGISGVGGVQFGQPFYQFAATTCIPGGNVGNIFASSSSGGTMSYFLTGGSSYYAVNPQSGAITTTAVPPAGTTMLTVNAVSSTGQTGTTTISITSTCGGVGGIGVGVGGTSGGFGRGPPVFTQNSYQCQVPCSPTQTFRACVIKASNVQQDSMNYVITPTSQFFVDPNSGEIRTLSPLRFAGTYSVTASASDPYGNIATAPVTITVVSSC